MKLKMLGISVALVYGCILTTSALANDSGFYLGGSIGRAEANFDTSGGFSGPIAGIPTTLNSVSQNSSETAWKLFGGYQINKYFGAEVEYVDFGSYNFNGNFTLANVPFSFSGTDKITGYGLAAVGTYPFSDSFAVFGKLGVFRSKDEATVTIPNLASGSGSDDETGPVYGVGIKYSFNENVSVRGEYERFTGIGNSSGNTENTDINLYTVALVYKF